MASSAGEKGGVLDSLRQQQFAGDYLDLPGGHVGVFEAGGTRLRTVPFNRDDVLCARGFGLGVGLAAGLFLQV